MDERLNTSRQPNLYILTSFLNVFWRIDYQQILLGTQTPLFRFATDNKDVDTE